MHREHWAPGLDWAPPEPETAFADLAVRYLAAHGPADAHDLAFWFGTTLTNARRWIASAGDRCTQVTVDGETRWCRSADLEALAAKPPPRSRWPVHLLYRFDPLVLATRDKSWLIDDEHYKKVWRPSAHVEAVLLVAGRIAGTWRYDRKGGGLVVTLRPFGPLGAGVRRALEGRAREVAAFLELPLIEVTFDG